MKQLKQLFTGVALASAMTFVALPVSAEGMDGAAGAGGSPAAPDSVGSPAGMDHPGSQPTTPGTAPDGMGSDMTGTSKSSVDFSSVDSNKDGKISMGEYLKQGGTRDSFQQSDKNADGKLDSSELLAQ